MSKDYDPETGPYLVGSDEWIVHQGMRHLLLILKDGEIPANIKADVGKAMGELANAQARLRGLESERKK